MTDHDRLYRPMFCSAVAQATALIAVVLLCATTGFGQTNPAAIRAALAEKPSVVKYQFSRLVRSKSSLVSHLQQPHCLTHESTFAIAASSHTSFLGKAA